MLESSNATTAADFDEELLAVLASDQFMGDMERSRDSIVEYVERKRGESRS